MHRRTYIDIYRNEGKETLAERIRGFLIFILICAAVGGFDYLYQH